MNSIRIGSWGEKMPKLKITSLLIVSFLSSSFFAAPVDASPPPTMVIMDTALDTSIPEIKNNLIHEVCILEWNSCPNGRDFMEGPGASTLPANFLRSSGFNHGTQMASIAIRTYPDVRIIFLRIIANSYSGARLTTSDRTVYQSLEWVLNNRDKYNIVSIGLSQSHHRLLSYSQYCPISLRTNEIVKKLSSAGVALFVASGNDNDKNRVSWPGCIPEAMAVSAITNNAISRYSNFDKNLSDYATVGELRVFDAGGTLTNASGTSVSAQVMAALWTQVRAEYQEFTFQDTAKFFQDIAKIIKVGEDSLRWIDTKVVNETIFRANLVRAGIDLESLPKPICPQAALGKQNSRLIQTFIGVCRL